MTPTAAEKDTIKAIRQALKDRSGRAWSVQTLQRVERGNRILITAYSHGRPCPCMEAADRAELSHLLSMPIGPFGVTVPDNPAGHAEFVARARGEYADDTPQAGTMVDQDLDRICP